MSVPVLPDTAPAGLVGRDGDIARIRAALAQPGTAGVVLFGDAGVGKTRLARHLLAGMDGSAVEWAPATASAATTPYGAFTHFLPPIARSSTPGQLHQALRTALLARAGERRLVLGVDDIHFLDDRSAALLQHLVLAGGCVLVATVRTSLSCDAPAAVRALWEDGTLARTTVDPLERPATAELLASLLGSLPDDPTVARLWAWCGGNPLLLQEAVRAEVAAGSLQLGDSGSWHWEARGATAGLTALIGHRLAGLDAASARAVDVVALGEPVELAVLAQIVAEEQLASLGRRGFVEISDEVPLRRRTVRLAHPLLGEAVRDGLEASRAASLSGELAATGARRSGDLLRLARLRLAAGEAVDPDLLVRAARLALTFFDHTLAEELAAAALEAGGGLAAGLVLGMALHRQARVHEARACLAGVAALATTEQEVVDLTEQRSLVLYWGLHRVGEAIGLVARVAATVTDEGPRSELVARQAVLLLFSGQPLAAVEPARAVLDAEGASDLAKLHAATALAGSYALTGRYLDATGTIDASLERAIRLFGVFPMGLGQLLGIRTSACRWAGRYFEAEAHARQLLERSSALGSHEGRALSGVLLGQTLLGQGQVDPAIACLTESAGLLRELDPIGFLPLCLGSLTQARALAGDLTGAAQILDEARTSLTASTEAYRPDVELGEAGLAAAQGDTPAARAAALRLADWAAARGQRSAEVVALHTIIRLGDHTVVDRLAAVVAAIDGPIAPVYLAHAAALAAGDRAGLAAASLAFEQECGALLLAAEAAAQAGAAERAGLLLRACPGAAPSATPGPRPGGGAGTGAPPRWR